MKKYFFFLFFLVGFAAECSIEEIKEHLELQQKYCPGNWCLVPWEDGWCCAEILAIKDTIVAAKVIDTSLHVNKWPIRLFDLSMIRHFKCSMSTTLEDLISHLKEKRILRTDFIESAFRAVDRSYFCKENPYFDAAINIPCDMCISTPHMHLLALELMKEGFSDAKKILDVGTGTGYMAAVFSYLAPQAQIYGIDCFEELVEQADKDCKNALPESMYKRITLMIGEGEKGHEAETPYDLIHVGYMCQSIPTSLIKQLKRGGILIIPIGSSISTYDQRLEGGYLMVIEKDQKGIVWAHKGCSCSFIETQKDNPKAFCKKERNKKTSSKRFAKQSAPSHGRDPRERRCQAFHVPFRELGY